MTREQDIKQTRREGTRGGIRGEGGAGGDQYDQTVAELTSAYGAHPPVVSCKVLYQIPLSATFPGFPNRGICASVYQTDGGWVPCGLPYSFARIMMRRTCASWRKRHGMPTRPDAC